MIDTTLDDLLRRSRDCAEGIAIQRAYEAGRAAGRLEGLEEAKKRIRKRLLPKMERMGPYCRGLLMAINDICDLIAGGRLLEETRKK